MPCRAASLCAFFLKSHRGAQERQQKAVRSLGP